MKPSRPFLPLAFLAFLPLFVLTPITYDPYGQFTWNAPKIIALLLFLAFVFGAHPRLLVPPRDAVGALLALGMAFLTLSGLRLLFLGLPLEEVLLGSPLRSSGHGVYLLFLLAGTVFWNLVRESEERTTAFLRFLVLAGAVHAVIVVFQALGWDPLRLLFIALVSPHLPVGTVGHSGIIPPLLFLPLFVLLGTWKEWGREKLPLLLLLAFSLGLLVNRASLAGFALASLLFWFRTRSKPALLALLLVGVGAWAHHLFIPTQGKPAKEVASLSTWETRVQLWEMALHFALRAPWELLWGYGDWGGARAADRNGLPPAPFLRFVSLEMGLPSLEELKGLSPRRTELGFPGYVLVYEEEKGGERVAGAEFVNRFHNALLDVAFVFGVPFLLVWTALFFGPVLLLGKGQAGELGEAVRMGLIALFVYYQAWFPVTATEATLLAFALAAHALASQRRRGEEASTSSPAPVR
jgi:hypothetical protein